MSKLRRRRSLISASVLTAEGIRYFSPESNAEGVNRWLKLANAFGVFQFQIQSMVETQPQGVYLNELVMSETDEYILDAIKNWVWSGFYDPDEVDSMIDDVLEDDADEAMLRAAVAPEFAKKSAAEASWPSTTDCDRLDQAFAELNSRGIIALHNAGYTMSDGISDVSEVLHERGRTGIKGYCFYHGQDVERAVAGWGLTVAFGDLDDDKLKKTEIGHLVKDVLQAYGFTVEWNGDPETRLTLPKLDWKRRRAV